MSMETPIMRADHSEYQSLFLKYNTDVILFERYETFLVNFKR